MVFSLIRIQKSYSLDTMIVLCRVTVSLLSDRLSMHLFGKLLDKLTTVGWISELMLLFLCHFWCGSTVASLHSLIRLNLDM